MAVGEEIVKGLKQAVVVTINNQQTVLLFMPVGKMDEKLVIGDKPDQSFIAVMHDNRIYAFTGLGENAVRDKILNMMTMPKYRILSSLFFVFRLLDHIGLASILVLSLYKGQLTQPTAAQIALFSTIGLELFYDVLVYTSKFWFLQRLHPYIGTALFVGYFIICSVKFGGFGALNEDQELVMWVLALRFGAFVFEEVLDIAIDMELHNDLCKDQTLSNDKKSKQDESPSFNLCFNVIFSLTGLQVGAFCGYVYYAYNPDTTDGTLACLAGSVVGVIVICLLATFCVKSHIEALLNSHDVADGLRHTSSSIVKIFEVENSLHEDKQGGEDKGDAHEPKQTARYEGSFSAWLPRTVFDMDCYHSDLFGGWTLAGCYVIPVIIIIPPVCFLFTLIACIGLIFLLNFAIFYCCPCKIYCTDTKRRERLLQELSWKV